MSEQRTAGIVDPEGAAAADANRHQSCDHPRCSDLVSLYCRGCGVFILDGVVKDRGQLITGEKKAGRPIGEQMTIGEGAHVNRRDRRNIVIDKLDAAVLELQLYTERADAGERARLDGQLAALKAARERFEWATSPHNDGR